jgi:hypothetical protein
MGFESSSGAINQEMEEEIMDPLDAKPLVLKQYALVSTLQFPGKRVLVNLSRNKMVPINDEFWKVIPNPQFIGKLKLLIQGMIRSTQASEKNSVIKAKRFLKEIFF